MNSRNPDSECMGDRGGPGGSEEEAVRARGFLFYGGNEGRQELQDPCNIYGFNFSKAIVMKDT